MVAALRAETLSRCAVLWIDAERVPFKSLRYAESVTLPCHGQRLPARCVEHEARALCANVLLQRG